MPEAAIKDTASTPNAPTNVIPTKEKTMATQPVTSLAQIDATKETSTQEKAAIQSNRAEQAASPQFAGEAYVPGKYSENKFAANESAMQTPASLAANTAIATDSTPVEEEKTPGETPAVNEVETVPEEAIKKEAEQDLPKEVEKKGEEAKVEAGTISSKVGNVAGTKEKPANAKADVLLVQNRLLELGILAKDDHAAESAISTDFVSKDKLTKTIIAIEEFQALFFNADGVISPGKTTIQKLTDTSITASKVTELKEAKAAKDKADKEAAAKAEEEAKKAKEKLAKETADKEAEEKRIDYIKNLPSTPKAVEAILERFNTEEKIAKLVKSIMYYNPLLVKAIYKELAFSDTDDVSLLVMEKMSDSEIKNLPSTIDELFYISMDEGWTDEAEYAQMSKLEYGKKSEEGKETAEDEKSTAKGAVSSDVTVDKNYKSGISSLYGSRNNFTKHLRKTELSSAVGTGGAENDKADIELVKAKLKEKKFEVKGDKIEDLIVQIKAFQGTFLKAANIDGNISPTGTTAQKLGLAVNKGSIGSLSRTQDKNGNYSYAKGTSSEDYYEKMDILNENLTKEGTKERQILDLAQKVAKNEKEFEKIEKTVDKKIVWGNAKKVDGDDKISTVLLNRMERFHKFCVSIGLYEGNMEVTNAVRDKAVSHKWSAEHFILYNTKQDHWATIKKNLIKMYNDSAYRDGVNVKDLDGNVWAQQEHFIFDKKDTEMKRAIDINFDLVKDFVKKYKYRSCNSSIAAEGYVSGNNRLPLPISGTPGVSNHIAGNAIDINSNYFINKNDAIIDLIALNFGVVRCASGEQWHFERTDLGISTDEKELLDNENKE